MKSLTHFCDSKLNRLQSIKANVYDLIWSNRHTHLYLNSLDEVSAQACVEMSSSTTRRTVLRFLHICLKAGQLAGVSSREAGALQLAGHPSLACH